LGEFFKRSCDIAAGYTEAVFVRGRSGEIAWFGAAACLLLAVSAALEMKIRRRPEWLLTGTLAVILFLDFKHGYVRHDDPHAWCAMVSLTSLILLLAPFAWRQLKASRLKWLVVAAGVVGATAFINHADMPGFPEEPAAKVKAVLAYLGKSPCVAAESAAGLVRAAIHPGEVARVHEAGMARIRAAYPLPRLTGTVDMFAPDQAAIYANGLEYRPRPGFQSYAAFTPQIAELDRRALTGPDSPDNIIFGIEDFDARLPSLEDGPSWPELLTRYDLTFASPQFLVLKKSPAPRRYILEYLGETDCRWDQVLATRDIRPDEALWAEVVMRPTMMGRIRQLFYKPDDVGMRLMTTDHRESTTYRMIPGMARAGFLLSPLVTTNQDFARLYSDAGIKQLEGRAVAGMLFQAFEHPKAPFGYEKEFTIRLYKLKYDRR
jgi:hypothetical protein